MKDIHAAGHEVTSHSWDHQRVHRFTPDTFRDDLRRSKDALEDVTGSPILGLSFSPYGTYVALGYDMQTEIWNLNTRALVSGADTTSFVDAVAFSASGGAVISGEDDCGRVLVCAD